MNHDVVQTDINNMVNLSSNRCLYVNMNKSNVFHSGEQILTVIIACPLVKLIIKNNCLTEKS